MHRRHDDAVAQLDAADGQWRKQQNVTHGRSPVGFGQSRHSDGKGAAIKCGNVAALLQQINWFAVTLPPLN